MVSKDSACAKRRTWLSMQKTAPKINTFPRLEPCSGDSGKSSGGFRLCRPLKQLDRQVRLAHEQGHEINYTW